MSTSTALEEAQHALRESQARLLALLQASFEGLMIAVDDKIALANPAIAELVGYSTDELVGMTPHDLTPPESAERVLAAMRSGDERPYEIEMLHRDGHRIPVELHGRNIQWEGRPARVTGLRDLTERRRAQESLRDSERRFRELADLLPVMVGETDERGFLTFINRTGLQFLRYDDDSEIIGRPVMDLVAPQDREAARDNLMGRLAGEELGPQQYFDIRRDGSTFPAMHYIGVIERDGQVVGTRTAVIDLTERIAAEDERRRLELQVLHSQKLESLGVLAGGIAHDFNNLLATILGNAEVALLDLAVSAPGREPVARIKRATLRAAELVRELLAYAGKGPSQTASIDLNDLVRSIVDLLGVSATRRVHVDYQLQPDLPRLQGDAAQLSQVVMNLVTNAADSLGPEGGRITVATRHLREPSTRPDELLLGQALGDLPYLSLEVHDTGVGMDGATLPRIFEPFFTTKFAGRGLGLAAVLGIARAHKGTVAVRSELGRGTVFRLLLPVLAGRSESAPKPHVFRAATDWQSRCSILLVDDDVLLLETTTAMLERMGLTVRTATTGEEALRSFAAQRPDAVLLDWTMPGMPSRAVLQSIRAANPDLPVVLTSGFGESEAVSAFEDVRLDGFLPKPFGFEALVSTLRRVLPDD